MKYAIETDTFCDGWVNTWTDDDESPVLFDTLEQAQQELADYLFELSIEVDLGNIEDYSPEDYRIGEVTA
jgi:hypothetical protein